MRIVHDVLGFYVSVTDTALVHVRDPAHQSMDYLCQFEVTYVMILSHKISKRTIWTELANDGDFFLLCMYEQIVCFDEVLVVENPFDSIMLFYVSHILWLDE